MVNYKVKERETNGGIQKLYRFENDFGASVVRHDFSYGNSEGLWELAVIEFVGDGDNDFEISYSTHITDDVLGYLSDEDVMRTLGEIKSL